MCAELAARFPDVTVRPDAIYVRDDNVVTSAGVTAGTDLALALVEDDHGPDAARAVARQLVVFLHRPGGQSQFSDWDQVPPASAPALRTLIESCDAGVGTVARRCGFGSGETMRRVFLQVLGTTPTAYRQRSLYREGEPMPSPVSRRTVLRVP